MGQTFTRRPDGGRGSTRGLASAAEIAAEERPPNWFLSRRRDPVHIVSDGEWREGVLRVVRRDWGGWEWPHQRVVWNRETRRRRRRRGEAGSEKNGREKIGLTVV